MQLTMNEIKHVQDGLLQFQAHHLSHFLLIGAFPVIQSKTGKEGWAGPASKCRVLINPYPHLSEA